jgi:cell wall-associated NlpC family hydrolase
MRFIARLSILLALLCAVPTGNRAAEESLGDKIKKIFEPTPTPTPHKHHKTTTSTKKKKPSPSPSPAKKKKSSPTPSPSPKAKAEASPNATPEETPEPSPSVSPKKKKSSPSPSPTKKKKSSTTSSPSHRARVEASPTATPEETPEPSPSASPKKHKKTSPTPTPEISPFPSAKKHKVSPKPAPSETEAATPAPSPAETLSPSATPANTPVAKKKGAPVTISSSEIVGYENYPSQIRTALDLALDLAGRGLNYKYGSADPANGGLDCSGFVYYVLTQSGVPDVPRDSSQQYIWLRKAYKFQPVISRHDDSFELDALSPGDLLFWTGTYNIDRDPPITHAMIYLGREKSTGQRIMVGASDGRIYKGESRYGVSIFDFKIPQPVKGNEGKLTPVFVGYGHVPGLRGQ